MVQRSKPAMWALSAVALILFLVVDIGLWAASSLPINRLDPAFALFGRFWAVAAVFICLRHVSLNRRAFVAICAVLMSTGAIAFFANMKGFGFGFVLPGDDLFAPIMRHMLVAIMGGLVYVAIIAGLLRLFRGMALPWVRRSVTALSIILMGLAIPQICFSLFAGFYQENLAKAQKDRPRLTLLTSLPLPFGDATGDMAIIASGRAQPHPALGWIASQYQVNVMTALTPEQLAMAPTAFLAQPRALTPQENVALDAWVRGGGKALILADPKLDWEPPFPLGDPRNPVPTTLLSPILTYWGLSLSETGEWQSAGSQCTVGAMDKRIAFCKIGAGFVTLYSDADFLDTPNWAGPGRNGFRAAGWNSPKMLELLWMMEQRQYKPASPAFLHPVWQADKVQIIAAS